MIESAILLMWIGFGSLQALDIEMFPSMEECQRAAEVLRNESVRLDGKCLPISVEVVR
jgi:hypothetical protein